ncbi:MAG TPA: DUF4382 domain-containing protein [Candidatus Polarisedimenticolaceae bacterium]|nr:DUF4382 domain-containing protein [Candidatus Polarisedimenticolaceae bacterium]
MRWNAKLLAAIAMTAVGLFVLSCSSSNDPTSGGMGQVHFVMSAGAAPAGTASDGLLALANADGSLAPATEGDDRPRLQAANVTFTSILARNLDGQLVPVSTTLPTTVDVLTLVNGREVTLPVGFLPPGTYDQLVVVMDSVDLLTENGTHITITPPGGGWTSIVRVRSPFVVTEGQTTTIQLRFRWWSAFRWMDDHMEFDPQFDCEH